jgi:hypothetical protein
VTPGRSHRWSAWYPVQDELLERRCATCGTVERISRDALADAVIADAVRQLRAVQAALENGGGGER